MLYKNSKRKLAGSLSICLRTFTDIYDISAYFAAFR